MDYEIKDVKILTKENNLLSAKFHIWEQCPDDEYSVQLSLEIADNKLTKIESDFFTALCEIRRDIESDGKRIVCFGASKNVYPSPMLQNMSGGEKAYKLILGKQAEKDKIVSIFDSGDDVEISTVEEQKSFYDSWINSLTK